MRRLWNPHGLVLTLRTLFAMACGAHRPPGARPTPSPPPPSSTTATQPPTPPEPVAEPTIVPAEPVRDDAISSASLDDLNRNSPMRPVYFEYDSSELTPESQKALDANAAVLKR